MATKPQKMPKVAKVKDKSPAEMQITAEQLLREAKERELEIVPPPPKQKIADPEELQEYRLKKRRAFEDNIRKNRGNVSNWLKYSKWEEEQTEIRRARSVYERALDVEHRNITLWLKYAEMEMRSKQVNHARNVWDRAVTIMPRVSQFWYKYTYMEEMLRNVAGAREVFERWTEWEPDEQAWQTYIKFELRYKELDRARQIYERFVYVHPQSNNWIKYCRFEENHGYINSCRRVYERAVEFYGDDHLDEPLFVAFAKFEEGQKEHDRARAIYKYALGRMSACPQLHTEYTRHEKKYGDRSAIDDVITSKRRVQYEAALEDNSLDYDTWFDYVRMMEAEGAVDVVRETYERAIACVPPVKEKKHWRRYIFLWQYYALYEETVTKDYDRAREVYLMCLKLIPHKLFTFAEIWLMYAKFEIRRKDLTAARKTLGRAIGMCPKHKLFRGYIDLEIKLREFDRCRKLYEKWVMFDPENCKCWIQFATLETMLSDHVRARSIFELAVSQTRLDMPEYMWKAYIDSEVEQEEWPTVRSLYERLLQRTDHVKVWLSYARTEQSISDIGDRPRKIYQRGNIILRSCPEKEQRIMLLEAWRDYEQQCGTDDTQKKVQDLMPRRVTKRKQVTAADGNTTQWEECIDYIFPDDETAKPSLMLLAKAKEWMKKKQETAAVDEDASDNEINNTEQITSNQDAQKGSEDTELSEREREKQKMIQEMFTDEPGNTEEPCTSFDPNIDKDDSDVEIGSSAGDSDSSSSSSDSDEEINVSKKERIRKKMEMFRSMRKSNKERVSNVEGEQEHEDGHRSQKSPESSSSSSRDEEHDKVNTNRKQESSRNADEYTSRDKRRRDDDADADDGSDRKHSKRRSRSPARRSPRHSPRRSPSRRSRR